MDFLHFFLATYPFFFVISLVLRITNSNYVYFEPGRYEGSKYAFLLTGILAQPETAFEHVSLPGYTKIYCNYSNFGFNYKKIAEDLEYNYRFVSKESIVCGVSVGARVVLCSDINRQILINPCIGPEDLRPTYYWLIKLLSPIAELISYGLGIISFLPLIPSSQGFHSVALLADQLFTIGYGRRPKHTHAKTEISRASRASLAFTGIVLSRDDKFLQNETIVEKYSDAKIARVNTKHARISDVKDAPKYQKAIMYILENTP